MKKKIAPIDIRRNEPQIDLKKNMVDNICMSNYKDILTPTCELSTLKKFAKLNDIKISKTDDKKSICNKIALKYETTLMMSAISTCQINIDNLILKAKPLLDNPDVTKDLEELQSWWRNRLVDVQKSIDSKNFNKILENKSLIKQSCNTFTTAINKKLDILLSKKKSKIFKFKIF